MSGARGGADSGANVYGWDVGCNCVASCLASAGLFVSVYLPSVSRLVCAVRSHVLPREETYFCCLRDPIPLVLMPWQPTTADKRTYSSGTTILLYSANRASSEMHAYQQAVHYIVLEFVSSERNVVAPSSDKETMFFETAADTQQQLVNKTQRPQHGANLW